MIRRHKQVTLVEMYTLRSKAKITIPDLNFYR